MCAVDVDLIIVVVEVAEVSGKLLDSAKQARADSGSKVGHIDFHVLKSADMLNDTIGKVREEYPYLFHKTRLLGRPYTYDQMDKLWNGLIALRSSRFATSQMNQLAESLFTGRRESTLFFRYQHSRDRSTAYTQLEKLLGELQPTTATDPVPWQRVSGGKLDYDFQTALWDLAELYDFVPR